MRCDDCCIILQISSRTRYLKLTHLHSPCLPQLSFISILRPNLLLYKVSPPCPQL